jgi:hypothetical protein
MTLMLNTLMPKILIFVFAFVLLSVGISRTVHAQDDYIRAERLGINHISGADIPFSETRYQRALELGAGWNRWAMYWNNIEARRGIFDWAAYDELVERDLEYGLDINAILLGIPTVYRDGETISGLDEPIFHDGTDIPSAGKFINPLNPFAGFVFRAVSRYMPGGLLAQERAWTHGHGIEVWEIWNEPDFTQFWRGGIVDYARMLKVAYIVIHALDPNATVMFGGLLYPTTANWFAYVLRVIERDPLKEAFNWFFDAVAIHSYTDSWRSGWLTLYVRQTMVEFGIERAIWLNESGAAIWDDYPGPTWLTDASDRSNRLSAEEQAGYFIQSAAWAYAEGAQKVFLFQLYDDCGNQPPGTNFTPHNGELCSGNSACFGDAFGIYTNAVGSVCFAQHPRPDSPRPIAEAYRLVAEVFGTEAFSPRGIIDTTYREGVVMISFSRPAADERIVVMWNVMPRAIELPVTALGTQAELIALDRREVLLSTGGQYLITLAPSQSDRILPEDDGLIPNGGSPLILIERLPPSESINLQVRTMARPQSDFIGPTQTPLPELGISDEELRARLEASGTGAIFTALQHARYRDLPTTEGSIVLGTMPPNNSATLLGRLSDDSWYQIDYDGRAVWVAAFLGAISGDLTNVPIIAYEPPPTFTPTLEPVQETTEEATGEA